MCIVSIVSEKEMGERKRGRGGYFLLFAWLAIVLIGEAIGKRNKE